MLSPHLDDAILSLGAAIAFAAARGSSVRIVTVLANDPGSSERAAPWDRACGFSSAGEAALRRREEDRQACRIVGAECVWLALPEGEYGGPPPADVARDEIVAAVGDVDALLVPGFPLDQPDHAWVTELVLEGPPLGPRIGLYVEQPYAALRLMGRGRRTWTGDLSTSRGVRNSMRIAVGAGAALQRPGVAAAPTMSTLAPEWGALRVDGRARRAKRLALRAYRSQVPNFGPLVVTRMALYERSWRGEGLAWLS